MTEVLTGELLPAHQPLPAAAAPHDGVPTVGGAADNELEELLREWLIGYASPHTRKAYRRDLQHWLAFLATSGVDPLTEARRVHTHAWLRAQEASGAAAAATRARRLAAVSAFYGWLIAEDRTDRANPAAIDSRKKPKVDQRSTKTSGLSRGQAEALLLAADADTGPQALRTAAIVALLLYTGIRVGELVDADVEQLGHHRGHRTLRFTAKGAREHLVALPAPVTRRLDAYLATRADLTGPLPVVAGQAGVRAHRPLVATASGARLDRGAVTRLVIRLAEVARIPVKMSPHVLRHACATLARDAGASLEDVQDQLGHADARTTRRYDHGGARLDRAPAYTLAAYLNAGDGHSTESTTEDTQDPGARP
ncbi:tyrosine-type recombinase/integrase [Micromonospora sp. WMMD710]|uniref:tyrosine-type recombinase/integrase n=1 Tax=Micromonospora sp. WMMD710 TaxID=3016085 RepID=UPI002417B3D6|nr:tyrosine-type recombinase/integrase [Micromonospora sp. WMMD710]MDG4759287.1 tyrosine-type recombinase/integrase [Micromonospora sp. WMMD710]